MLKVLSVETGASLVVQLLSLGISTTGGMVPSLVGEVRNATPNTNTNK